MRRTLQIGPRTRARRNGLNMKARILEVIEVSNQYPGYFNEATTAAFQPAYMVAYAWRKHVECYRIDPVLGAKLRSLTPYQFISLLGQMIDAGVTNAGEGEAFFYAMGRAA